MSRSGGDTGRRGPRADSLLAGVAFLLGVTVVQRGVGLLRSVLFCGMLDDQELGRWSLAFSFLLTAAPLAVIGLPGTFGRYVEYYGHRGLVKDYLRSTLRASVCGGLLLCTAMLLFPSPFAWLILHDAEAHGWVRLLAVTLAGVIACNLVTELLMALRLVRASGCVQFLQSLVFAGVALLLLWRGGMREHAVAVGFAAGAVLAAVAGAWVLRHWWKELDEREAEPGRGDAGIWSKVLPFAGWVWLGNLVTNLFEAVDRFMILHLARVDTSAAESLVGQYHCSRIGPLLLVSLCGILAGTLLPYFSRTWEQGQRSLVGQQVGLSLKITAVGLTLAGGLFVWMAPTLFRLAWGARYDTGLAVLPMTVTYCCWFSMMMLAQNYMWCAERARWVSLTLLAGLVLNVVLNAAWLPRWGLAGAVAATSAANLGTLGLLLAFNRRMGMHVDRGLWVFVLLPASLLLGAAPACSAALGTVVLTGCRGRWLTPEQRSLWDEACARTAARWSPRLKRIATTA